VGDGSGGHSAPRHCCISTLPAAFAHFRHLRVYLSGNNFTLVGLPLLSRSTAMRLAFPRAQLSRSTACRASRNQPVPEGSLPYATRFTGHSSHNAFCLHARHLLARPTCLSLHLFSCARHRRHPQRRGSWAGPGTFWLREHGTYIAPARFRVISASVYFTINHISCAFFCCDWVRGSVRAPTSCLNSGHLTRPGGTSMTCCTGHPPPWHGDAMWQASCSACGGLALFLLLPHRHLLPTVYSAA